MENKSESLQLGRERAVAAQNIVTILHDEYECHVHKKRIFNCRGGSDNGNFYYEACCPEFRDFMSKEIDSRFGTW
jgi:hypothetical protein